MIRSIIPRSISIRQLYPATRTPLTIYGDRTQIQQVVINLASNAIHAMRAHGGEIVVEVRDLGADCAIVVRDDGSGIDPEIQLHIFEPFFTTKPVGEGTGMGLSVVQGIVNSHLGRIDITPGLPKGSEFVITLPLSSAPPAEKVPEPVSEDVLLQGGDETILVVDDEADLTAVIADTLEIFGYTALKAHNAEEALKVIEARGSEIDLILTDDSMPGMTGLEFAVHLQKSPYAGLRIPVVLMTGYYRHEPTEDTECAAIQAFLRKPLDAEVLNEVIRTTLDRP
jgi:CheY-like chemotaxis protein